MDVPEAKRLKQLEDENAKLKLLRSRCWIDTRSIWFGMVQSISNGSEHFIRNQPAMAHVEEMGKETGLVRLCAWASAHGWSAVTAVRLRSRDFGPSCGFLTPRKPADTIFCGVVGRGCPRKGKRHGL